MSNINKSFSALKSLTEFIYLMQKEKGKLNDEFTNNYQLCKKIASKVIDDLNIEFNVFGDENIPKNDQTLITSNHKGFIDILVLLKVIERNTSFVTAQELFDYPILSNYIKSIQCVPVDRNNSFNSDIMKRQIMGMKNALKAGCSVVFPEGIAHHFDDEIGEFKKTAFLCAIQLDSYIVPTYIDIKDTKSFIEWVIPQEKMNIVFGKAFKPSEISDKRIKPEQLGQYTREKVLELKRQIR